MTPFGIVVKKGCGHRLDIRLCKLFTRTETLFHDRTRQYVTQTRAHHRRAASCGRRSKENLEDQVRLPLKGDQQFTFEFIRSEEHTSELQSLRHLVCRLLLEKKKQKYNR